MTTRRTTRDGLGVRRLEADSVVVQLAALATFPQTSMPGVVSVEVHGDRAEVVITTQPPHPDGC